MEFIKLTRDNIELEHLCCAISDKQCQGGVAAKKAILKSKLDKGYVFNKLNVRGKVFADYCPIEISLLPVHAEGYAAINCFWVSGQYAKQGYARRLITQCVADCSDSRGIIVIVGDKKRPYLPDKKFFQHFGFNVCDSAPPYFELLVYKNQPDSPDPRFFDSVKRNRPDNQIGVQIYYSLQCPFTDYYVNNVFRTLAEKYSVPFHSQKLITREDIQNLPTAHNIYSVFLDGAFITHEIMSAARIEKLLHAR